MSKKTCFKCGEEKWLFEFYKHKQMGDGHLNKCKECNKKDVSENYRLRREQYAKYERERYQRPERRKKTYEYAEKMRKDKPEICAARKKVYRAVKSGKIKKQPCEVCGKKAQAHHEDYSKPLDVNWLCRKHHLERHGKMAYEFK